MRIIFLDAVQDYGGSQKSTINLIKNLENQNACLFVDFWGSSNELINQLNLNKINHEILDKRIHPIIINEGNGSLSKIKNVTKYILNNFKLKKRFRDIIKDFEPDFIIVNNLKSISILEKGPYKIVYFERTWFANVSLNYFKRKLFKKVNYFFAVSEATRKAIYIKGIAALENIYVLPNSINDVKTHQEKQKFNTCIKLLNVGGYLPSKGLHHTLQIANQLKNKNIIFHIDIVGVLYSGNVSAKYYKMLTEQIEADGLKNFVTLHSNIKNMDSFYKDVDILIHPTYTEGLPRVIMEAMANNILVIANSVGGVNDYILNNYTGFLTDLNNIDKYVEYILKVFDNIGLYNMITKNANSLIANSYNDNIQKENINKIFVKINDNNRYPIL